MGPEKQLPQRLDWPEKPLPAFSWWSASVGLLCGAIALLLVGVNDLNVWVRIGIVLLSFVLPVVVWALWKYARIGWLRLRHYSLIYDLAEVSARRLSDMALSVTSLLRTLVGAGLQTFAVINVVMQAGVLYLVIGGSKVAEPLDNGCELLVVDHYNWDILGHFEVVDRSEGKYLLRELKIQNPIWWGWLHEQVANHIQVRLNAIAIVIPQRGGAQNG